MANKAMIESMVRSGYIRHDRPEIVENENGGEDKNDKRENT